MNQLPDADPHAAVLMACRRIEHSDKAPSLEQLAREAGLSRDRFYRMFIKVLGVTPKAYAMALRRQRLQTALPAAHGVAGAIFDAGFSSGSRVYEKPQALLGMTPAIYRRGAPGVEIRAAIARSTLGWLLVAASAKGICMIEFGPTPAALRAALRRRFPDARLGRLDGKLDRWLQRIVDYLRVPAGILKLPLDIQGTAFQQRVWQAQQSIPPGQTLSYSEVAQRVGKPGAARAIARAVAANPVAVAVPCHRVVGSDGTLRGYRWGLQRKQALIRAERECNSEPAGRVRSKNRSKASK
jgi:AraC family transcriptional regulator of adaptative response/methylated-DNA-[protein]-cysteine methyltransferase